MKKANIRTHLQGFGKYISEFDKPCTLMLHVILTATVLSLCGIWILILKNTAENIYLTPESYVYLIEYVLRFLTLSVFFILLFDYASRKNKQ